ncbi:Prevent-host-death protein [Beggiatoa sp. PS]|nr:Prevent-host-death protein [Beggiatoa sp. PS]
MTTLNEPYIETQNNQRGVFLDIAVYHQMLEILEALKSLHVDDIAKNDESQSLEDFLARIAANKERMTLTYEDKLFLAVVPIEEVDLIEQLETFIDAKTVKAALKEAEEKGTISSEQLDKQLGW